MTIQDYLTNPAGKGSTILGNQTVIKEKYEEESQELITSGNGNVHLYALQNRYLLFHYQLKSKSGSKYGGDLHYDIIFQIDTSGHKYDKICDIPFQVYSNCPSFLYTYAALFNTKKLLIPWSKKLYDSATLKKMAAIRNSYGIIGYERSLYITALLIRANYGLMTSEGALTLASKIQNTAQLEKTIASQSQMRSSFSSAKDAYRKSMALQTGINSPKKGNLSKVSEDIPESSLVPKTKKTAKTKKSTHSKKI